MRLLIVSCNVITCFSRFARRCLRRLSVKEDSATCGLSVSLQMSSTLFFSSRYAPCVEISEGELIISVETCYILRKPRHPRVICFATQTNKPFPLAAARDLILSVSARPPNVALYPQLAKTLSGSLSISR